MGIFFHSVTLDESKCVGCTNCIKRCPTEAIRVRNGKAVITSERCIDCGECIRICPHHAKRAKHDHLSMLENFTYNIALPAPSLYGQFNNLDDQDYVLTGLKKLGFDDVVEVSGAAELVSEATRRLMDAGALKRPVISSACPAIVRLIRVRFPDLCDHVLPLLSPMETAATIAKRKAREKTGLPEEQIGCFFITPCPAKVTDIRMPIGIGKSKVDGAIAISEIFPQLSHRMDKLSPEEVEPLSSSGIIGVSWASSGGESSALLKEKYLAADGIENVIRVLEEIENDKLPDLVFFEGAACTGGCVGGPLTFENTYVARGAVRALMRGCDITHPDERVRASYLTKYNLLSDKNISANSAMRLDDDIVEAMRKMEEMEDIVRRLPGYDCGSCGSPTCRTFAEDIVRGYCNEMDCIHILKEQLKVMAQKMVELAKTTRE